MKNFKMKLSVLALACLGAGALALQPANYAKAEGEEFDAKGVVMQAGAAVCVNDYFSGIRWTTTIDGEWYADVAEKYMAESEEGAGDNAVKGVRFGVVVAPNGSYEGDLTLDDESAMELHAQDLKASTKKDVTFYSVISYDQLLEEYEGEMSEAEVLEKAYAMELTVRAYARYTLNDGNNTFVYAYADQVDTSRSAQYVALSAELAGELNVYRESADESVQAKAQKAAAYYGYGADAEDYYKGFTVSNGAAGTQYIDLSEVAEAAKEVAVALTVAEGYEIDKVFVGTKAVEGTYEEGTLTLNLEAGQALPTGETYVIAYAKNDEGDVAVYTKPIIGATKVLTTAEDLKMFNAKGDNYDRTTKTGTNGANIEAYWKPEQEQSGYYVLGGNIDASAYTHGSVNAADAYKNAGKANDSTWNGMVNYIGRPIGLSGTFNGLGYTIDGITIGTQREGIFGIVNGGTVKNVAFENVKNKIKYANVIANYLYNATIDNVYIATNAYVKSDANNPGYAYTDGSGLVASMAYGTTKISNTYIRLNKQSGTTKETTFGALFGSTHSTESFTCENVIVLVRQHFTYMQATTTVTDDVETTTYAAGTMQYYVAMAAPVKAATAEGDATVIETKGTLYLAENQTSTALSNGKSFAAGAYDVLKTLNGVYYYGQKDTWAEHDYAGFLASGCWKMSDGRPVWKS